MSSRFTTTEKWDDRWFRKRTIEGKVLFGYLCDKCDLAGFWEVDLEHASYFTGIPETEILGALEGLNERFIRSGKYLWVCNFIKHQRNLPLNPNNNAHKHILSLLASHSEFNVDFLSLLKNSSQKTPLLGPKEAPCKGIGIGIGRSKGKGKGKTRARRKVIHDDFVKLTEEEHAKLIDKFGEQGAADWIAELDGYIGSKGDSYKSHYLTILNWNRRRDGKQPAKKTRLFPISGKTCSKRRCPLPAVYKDISGDYDHFYCTEHMPEKVKEKYE